MSKKKYDTKDPILVIVKRGRNGRGYTIAPVEDAANPAMCGEKEEMGEILEEMLNDEGQPRVNLQDLLASSPPVDDHDVEPEGEPDGEPDGEGDDEDWEEGEDEDGDEPPAGSGGILDGVAGSDDPAETLLVNIFHRVIKGGQDMSSKPRGSRTRTRRRRTSGGKKK